MCWLTYVGKRPSATWCMTALRPTRTQTSCCLYKPAREYIQNINQLTHDTSHRDIEKKRYHFRMERMQQGGWLRRDPQTCIIWLPIHRSLFLTKVGGGARF